MIQSFDISRSDVMTEVRKTLGYIGALHVTENGGNMYDILAATPEQEEQLERFFEEGGADIATATKKYVMVYSADSNFTITYSLNDSFKIQMHDVVAQNMFSYLVNSIIVKWLGLTNLAADRIAYYQNFATSFLQAIRLDILANESNSKTYAEQATSDSIGGTSAMVISELSGMNDEDDTDGSIGGTSAMVIENNAGLEEEEEQTVIGQELPQDLQTNEHKIYKF